MKQAKEAKAEFSQKKEALKKVKSLKYLTLILLVFFLNSCAGRKVITDEEKFADFYVDLLISSEKNSGDINLVKSEREKIFQRYNFTMEEYKATLNYYNEKPERWKEFFDRVNQRLAYLRKNKKV